MPLDKYPDDAVSRASQAALEWLEGNRDGYPRTWEQEAANDARRDYVLYDEFEAPPIAGYEALEREGLVERLETIEKDGQARAHFVLRAVVERK